MATKYGITLDELYKLNPALNGDCSGLWAGYAYCVGVPALTTSNPAITTTENTSTTTSPTACATVTPPGPTQANIPCTCNRYLMQADGVYCYDMAAKEGITLDQLYEWNPSLNGDCSGLWSGYAYCVGVL
jgi:LysM repeat protein